MMSNQRRPRQNRPNGEQDRPVTFAVSTDMLRTLLKLASDVSVTGARIDRSTGDVVFTLDAPRAPKDATGLTVQYLRIPGKEAIVARTEWKYSEPPAAPAPVALDPSGV